MNRRMDLPWQSTNKRSLETVMFHNITGLLEMAVCCAKPPYRATELNFYFLSCTESNIIKIANFNV